MHYTVLLSLFTDIKPENLLISKNGVLKLCDFGEAFFLHIVWVAVVVVAAAAVVVAEGGVVSFS